jgi:hypothetical protein
MPMPLGPSKGLCLSLALLVVPAAVCAQDTVTHMTPGLWSYAVNMAGIDAGTMDLCLDADLKTALTAMGATPHPKKGTCDQRITAAAPGDWRIETTCMGPEHSTHTVMTVQELSPTHVKNEAATTVDGKPGLKTVMDAQRTGECPAKMKIGERKLHINLTKLPALMAAAKANQKRNTTEGQ